MSSRNRVFVFGLVTWVTLGGCNGADDANPAGGDSDPDSMSSTAFSGQCLRPSSELGAVSPVYAIKLGLTPLDQTVTLDEMVVTAITDFGFFAQLDPASRHCSPEHGTRRSGLFVFTGNQVDRPNVGQILSVSGTVQEWYGQRELANPQWNGTQHRTPETPATPTTIAEVMPGDADSDYEGVLVTVTAVTVADNSPHPGSGDDGQNELELDDGLRLDDFAGYALRPWPSVGDQYGAITGVVAWRNQLLKIGPRTVADINTCVPDCSNRECGPDPDCGLSCGRCDVGSCNAHGHCSEECVPDCSGRQCGPDPLCGVSCGTCAQGSCNAAGHCVAEPCLDPCDLGALRCGATGVEKCLSTATCHQWTLIESCGTSQVCFQRQCVPASCNDDDLLTCPDLGVCQDGERVCQNEAWSSCQWQIGPSLESCDGRDNDCDGAVDNNLPAAACPVQAGVCAGAVQHCSTSSLTMVCDAESYASSAARVGATYQPGEETLCDGFDNNCDGTVDELTRSDPANCGACGHRCPDDDHGAPTCSNSHCGIDCAGGFHECAGTCVDNDDLATCGQRCAPCPDGANGDPICFQEECWLQCHTGFHPEATGCVADCETGSCPTGKYCTDDQSCAHCPALDESEPNETRDQATTMTGTASGGAIFWQADGFICAEDDVDWWQVNLAGDHDLGTINVFPTAGATIHLWAYYGTSLFETGTCVDNTSCLNLQIPLLGWGEPVFFKITGEPEGATYEIEFYEAL